MPHEMSTPHGVDLRVVRNDPCPAGWALLGVMALRDPGLLMHSIRGTLVTLHLVAHTQRAVDRPTAWAFLLHDVGTLEIPMDLLETPGPLTQADRSVIRTHPVRSSQLVSQIPELADGADVILSHHERWDGTGYPGGLRGREIPQAARALAIGDAYAALTARRPHREAHDPELAAEVVADEASSHFDPELALLAPEIFPILPHNLVTPIDEENLVGLLDPRLREHALRAEDLAGAQLEALFAAALGLDAVAAAHRLGRAPGTQRTWAASLRRTLACPPRESLRRFLAEIGRRSFTTFTQHLWDGDHQPVAIRPAHP